MTPDVPVVVPITDFKLNTANDTAGYYINTGQPFKRTSTNTPQSDRPNTLHNTH